MESWYAFGGEVGLSCYLAEGIMIKNETGTDESASSGHGHATCSYGFE